MNTFSTITGESGLGQNILQDLGTLHNSKMNVMRYVNEGVVN